MQVYERHLASTVRAQHVDPGVERRQGDRHVGWVGGDAGRRRRPGRRTDRQAQDRVVPGVAADGGAALPRRPLVAGSRDVLEVDAPRPQQRDRKSTSELQSLMRISYAVFCLKKKKQNTPELSHTHTTHTTQTNITQNK